MFSSLPLNCPYPPVNRDPGSEVSSGDDHGVLSVIKDEAGHICPVFLAPLLWRAVLRWYGLILNDRKDLDWADCTQPKKMLNLVSSFFLLCSGKPVPFCSPGGAAQICERLVEGVVLTV